MQIVRTLTFGLIVLFTAGNVFAGNSGNIYQRPPDKRQQMFDADAQRADTAKKRTEELNKKLRKQQIKDAQAKAKAKEQAEKKKKKAQKEAARKAKLEKEKLPAAPKQ